MTSNRKTLLVGHSHVKCVELAARRSGGAEWLKIINLLRIDKCDRRAETVADLAEAFDPEVVALCLGGNFHNVIGLLEHPRPFSIGAKGLGAVPPTDGARRVIPRSLMRDLFRQNYMPTSCVRV